MPTNDIRVVVVTVDRAPKDNYLHATLDSLERSGLWDSERLDGFHLVDSGSPRDEYDPISRWPDRALANVRYQRHPGETWHMGRFDLTKQSEHGYPQCHVHYAPERRSGKQNTAAALRIGAAGHDGWVLHLEDDLAVCGDFLDSVGRWLDAFEGDDLTRPKRPLYAFSGDNSTIRTQLAKGEAAWEYPVEWFWGLQAFACRPAVAEDLATWLETHPIFRHTDGRPDENAHDLEMHNWARERDYTHFRGSCPSFVQHIGYETSIAGNVMGGKRVTFPTWPGPEWSFEAGRQA